MQRTRQKHGRRSYLSVGIGGDSQSLPEREPTRSKDRDLLSYNIDTCMCIRQGIIPDDLKRARVIPIHTKNAVRQIPVCLPVPLSRNHQGRRGISADIGDNLPPSLTVLDCSLTAVEVETGPLFDIVFPSFTLPSSFFSLMRCRTFLQRSLDMVTYTCPNHRNFLFSQL